jgi:polar amino acid transport system permease protein
MGNDFISMTKDSALVSATGFVHEIMWRATRVGRAELNNLEALIIAAAFYWILTLILSFFQSRIEARLAKGDR